MTQQTKQQKVVRTRYKPEYQAEALALADRIGVPEAARQLGIDSGLIYNWRKARRMTQTSAEAEQLLATENARLKRQLAEQTEELTILKKRRRTSRSTRSEIRLHGSPSAGIQAHGHGPCAGRFPQWFLRVVRAQGASILTSGAPR